MADPDPETVTTCGICVCDIVGAIGKIELVGWPDYDDEECPV